MLRNSSFQYNGGNNGRDDGDDSSSSSVTTLGENNKNGQNDYDSYDEDDLSVDLLCSVKRQLHQNEKDKTSLSKNHGDITNVNVNADANANVNAISNTDTKVDAKTNANADATYNVIDDNEHDDISSQVKEGKTDLLPTATAAVAVAATAVADCMMEKKEEKKINSPATQTLDHLTGMDMDAKSGDDLRFDFSQLSQLTSTDAVDHHTRTVDNDHTMGPDLRNDFSQMSQLSQLSQLSTKRRDNKGQGRGKGEKGVYRLNHEKNESDSESGSETETDLNEELTMKRSNNVIKTSVQVRRSYVSFPKLTVLRLSSQFLFSILHFILYYL